MPDKNRIFIADDDIIALKSLKELLAISGFEVETTENPNEVLAKVKAFKPQLILLDLIMPRLDGFEVCQILSQDQDTQGIPIIIVSALSGYTDIKKAYKLGVVGYFTKPYDFHMVLAEINKAVAYKEALQEERNFISVVLDAAGALIIILNEQGRILRFNRACEQISGYVFSEVAGRYIWDLFIAGDDLKTALRNPIASAFPRTYESQWITKSGLSRLISWTDTVIARPNDLVEYIIIAGIDITERKQAEQRIKKTNEELTRAHLELMQSAKMAAVGRLSTWIAHEIKNPLAIVLQGSEYVRSLVPSDSELSDSTERIVRAALRADKIVKDLLDFSRQPQSAEFREEDITAVIEESLALVEHQMSLRNIKIIRDFARPLAKVKINSGQMKQVFINILVNAVEAMAAGGTITVRLKEVSAQENERFLEIVFSDTGCGIAKEHLPKVFDPFFSTKKKEGSAGLGLAISKEIVEKHAGDISIESMPGEKTIVSIRLPVLQT